MGQNNQVMQTLMRGMEIKKQTFDFYARAEQRTSGTEGKKVFRWLAKTEEVHYQKLTEVYDALSQGGQWGFYDGSAIALEAQGAADLEADDLEALRFAMEVEKKGLAFFDELLEKTNDPEGKKMLQTLRAEEEEHLRVIAQNYQALREK